MSLASLRQRIEALTPVGKLRSSLFAQQLTFITDTAQRKAALCTRRAGKSHVAAIALILAAQSKPNTVALYLALTRRSAKAIMWFKLKELDRTYKLGLTFSESELIVHLANGSRIVLFGADLENLADRLRGDAYIRVVIDEAQSYGPHLQMLIADVLEPALLDHRGDLILIGTPGPSPVGVFFDATTDSRAWSTHRWSLLDNPHLPHAAAWLADLRASRGWAEDNPTWLREYCGQWVQDESALVYRGFKRHRNVFKMLPQSDWQYIVGMDLGWHDQTTFCVLAYSKHQPNAYVVRSFGRSELHISRIAEVLNSLVNEFAPMAIIADTGGLGKAICEELKSRYSLPIRAAEKTEKLTAIEALNGDFIDGRLLVHEGCKDLMGQYETLTWDEKRLHENPAMRNDLCLSGETLVSTNKGKLRIDCMDGTEMVLTRAGFAEIEWIGQTGVSDTIRVELKGTSIECTKQHPVWTQRGFVHAENLTEGDVVWLQSNGAGTTGMLQKIAKGKHIDAISQEFGKILMGVFLICCSIVRFGNFILGTSQKAIKFITKMGTQKTTTLRILNVALWQSTEKSTPMICSNGQVQRRQENIWKILGHSQKSGMHQRPEESGTESKGKRYLAKDTKKRLQLFVRCVDKSFCVQRMLKCVSSDALINATQRLDAILVLMTSQSLVFSAALRLFLTNTEKSNTVLRVVPARRQIPVFNLKTKSLPEFFANGVLVHNCDSVLYAARFSRHYWHRPKAPALTPAELVAKQERDMMDAVLSEQKQLIEERESHDPNGIGSVFGDTQSPWSSTGENW